MLVNLLLYSKAFQNIPNFWVWYEKIQSGNPEPRFMTLCLKISNAPEIAGGN
jgi:hypothetical protein